jgi:flagellar assembly protein FliH
MNNKKRISSEDSTATTSPAADSVLSAAPFVYRPAPGWTSAKEMAAASAIVAAGAAVAAVSPVLPEVTPTGEDARALEKQAWESGFREGLAKGRAEIEPVAKQQRDAIAHALAEFMQERHAYFLHVEGEVVSLALAIVRKILHRESQVDPLLLTGLVRVALEKMAGTENIRLRVNPTQLRIWQNEFANRSDLRMVPDCVADDSLELNQCRIETDHGVIDLHIEAQLKEIEQGLFDLLAQRPASK